MISNKVFFSPLWILGYDVQLLQHGWVCFLDLQLCISYMYVFHVTLALYDSCYSCAGIHQKGSFVILRVIPLISSVWHLSYGLQP